VRRLVIGHAVSVVGEMLGEAQIAALGPRAERLHEDISTDLRRSPRADGDAHARDIISYKDCVTVDAIVWLDEAVLVRVDTTDAGWSLDDEVVTRLLELPWRFVQVDRAGLRGVLEIDGEAVSRLGALTSAVDDLVTVEVRDDVAVAVVEARSAVQRTQVAGTIGTALAGVGGRPLGLFLDGATVAVAFERWRRSELATCLRTATSLSR
jgi:hypothetical protein